ncbi:MAG: linear amide C-N hydrolase [Chlamydiota bacterium]|nr:linear amide C-N hydrolase [Chlamydiota bacterium]
MNTVCSSNPYNIGCSDFFLNEQKIVGRTLDFPTPLLSNLEKRPRGETFTAYAPNGQESFSWTSEFGFVGFTAFGDDNQGKNVMEGMNEKGLKISLLTLSATTYQTVPEGEMDRALGVSDMTVWLLGTCQNIDEVKAALQSVYVWADTVPPFPETPLQHISIHDNTGASLVVEYVDGELNLYNNEVHMLTNDPVYPKQLENLRKYQYLNISYQSGQSCGSGMIGLPGDYTEQSRFVRGAKLLEFADVDSQNPINTALTILGTLDVPKGVKLASPNNNEDYDCTRWRTVTDIGNLVLYYSTIKDPTWYSVDLNQLDFSEGTEYQKFPIYKKQSDRPWAVSVNDKFQAAVDSNKSMFTRMVNYVW